VGASEPDLPLHPADIAGRPFARDGSGYAPAEVDAFLVRVAGEVARLETELDSHRARCEHVGRQKAAADGAASWALGDTFMDVVRALDEATARIRATAEADAKRSLAAAQEEAARIIRAAKEEARSVGVPAGMPAGRRGGRALVRLPEAAVERVAAATDGDERPS
jgi:DivIVA domain-containing protein